MHWEKPLARFMAQQQRSAIKWNGIKSYRLGSNWIVAGPGPSRPYQWKMLFISFRTPTSPFSCSRIFRVPPQALWIFNEFSIYLRASRGKIFRVLFIQTLDHHRVAFLFFSSWGLVMWIRKYLGILFISIWKPYKELQTSQGILDSKIIYETKGFFIL